MDEGGESGECRDGDGEGEGEGRSEMGLWMRVGSLWSVGGEWLKLKSAGRRKMLGEKN